MPWKDPINSGKSYYKKNKDVDNVVPCCGPCNRIRGIALTPDEMLIAMKAVLKFRRKHAKS
jgi:hypothetical protein